MRPYGEHDVEVALGSAVFAGIAFTGLADAGSALDSGGNFDGEFEFAADAGFAPAGCAGVADDLARATAGGTCAGHGEEALLVTDLSASLALGAGGGSASGGAAAAVACVAGFAAAQLDLGLGAEDRGFKVHRQVEAEIVAALLTAGTALLAAHIEHFAEKVAEEVADVDATAEGRAAKALTGCGVAVAVVVGALVGVAENLIRLAGLLETLLGGMIAGVEVRVMLTRHLAVGALQLLVAGAAGDAEYFVIVLLCVQVA